MSEFTSLEDLANNVTVEEIVESGPIEKQPSQLLEKIQIVLTAETGEGSIEDYINHPLNIRKNKGLAQVLRGLTGIIGNLKLAIIDIGLGVLNMRGANKNDGIYTNYKGDGIS